MTMMMMVRRQQPTLLLLLAVCLSVVKAAQEIPMDGFGADKPCRMFSCSKGYAPVPKKRGAGSILKLTSPGCSAMGGGMMMMTNPGGEEEVKPYESCCDEWHACYQICGSNKMQCDEAYKKCVDKSCGADEECSKGAELNIMMMKLGGCGKYEGAQNRACECVPKDNDKHTKARQSVLEKFYKKYSPENVSKAANLMEKANTAPKLAIVFQKLVHKYPESIEKVEDPQQAEMRRMMQDAKNNNKNEDSSSGSDGGGDEAVVDDESDETEDLDAKDEL